MEWLYGEKLTDPKIIERIEELVEYRYPEDYKALVLENDGAYPSDYVFDTEESVGRVLNNLISLGSGNLDGALDDILEGKKRQWAYEGLPWRYIPFGDDPGGNMICFDRRNDHVVYYDHETEDIEEVADSFSEFIESLYPSPGRSVEATLVPEPPAAEVPPAAATGQPKTALEEELARLLRGW